MKTNLAPYAGLKMTSEIQRAELDEGIGRVAEIGKALKRPESAVSQN